MNPSVGPRRFDIIEIAQEAHERAGLEFRSGYAMTTARRSLELLMLEWANRGLNLWCIEPGILDLEPDISTYDLPADTVDLLDCALRTSSVNTLYPNDRPLERLGLAYWPGIRYSGSPGPPNRYFVHRTVEPPTLYLEPVPNATSLNWPYQVVYQRLRYMAPLATRSGTATMDLPARFLPAMIAGLAYMLSMKSKDQGSAQRAPALKAVYEEAFDLASLEDRDRTSFFWVPAGSSCG